MNLVGQHGRGESVWLAFFLFHVLTQFAELARQRGDAVLADRYIGRSRPAARQHRGARLGRPVVSPGLFRRRHAARFGRRTKNARSMPSRKAGRFSRVPARTSGPSVAMESVDRRLVRRDDRLILLLDPPFDKSDLNPGYIKGYVPGVRENGGQYTHSAIWTVMATAAMGDTRAGVGTVLADQSDFARATPDGDRHLPRRTVRGGRRRLRSRAAHGPRRLDVVHRLGRLDVSPDRRVAPGPAPGSRQTALRAVPAGGLDRVQNPLSLSRDLLSHHHPQQRH